MSTCLATSFTYFDIDIGLYCSSVKRIFPNYLEENTCYNSFNNISHQDTDYATVFQCSASTKKIFSNIGVRLCRHVLFDVDSISSLKSRVTTLSLKWVN